MMLQIGPVTVAEEWREPARQGNPHLMFARRGAVVRTFDTGGSPGEVVQNFGQDLSKPLRLASSETVGFLTKAEVTALEALYSTGDSFTVSWDRFPDASPLNTVMETKIAYFDPETPPLFTLLTEAEDLWYMDILLRIIEPKAFLQETYNYTPGLETSGGTNPDGSSTDNTTLIIPPPDPNAEPLPAGTPNLVARLEFDPNNPTWRDGTPITGEARLWFDRLRWKVDNINVDSEAIFRFYDSILKDNTYEFRYVAGFTTCLTITTRVTGWIKPVEIIYQGWQRVKQIMHTEWDSLYWQGGTQPGPFGLYEGLHKKLLYRYTNAYDGKPIKGTDCDNQSQVDQLPPIANMLQVMHANAHLDPRYAKAENEILDWYEQEYLATMIYRYTVEAPRRARYRDTFPMHSTGGGPSSRWAKMNRVVREVYRDRTDRPSPAFWNKLRAHPNHMTLSGTVKVSHGFPTEDNAGFLQAARITYNDYLARDRTKYIRHGLPGANAGGGHVWMSPEGPANFTTHTAPQGGVSNPPTWGGRWNVYVPEGMGRIADAYFDAMSTSTEEGMLQVARALRFTLIRKNRVTELVRDPRDQNNCYRNADRMTGRPTRVTSHDGTVIDIPVPDYAAARWGAPNIYQFDYTAAGVIMGLYADVGGVVGDGLGQFLTAFYEIRNKGRLDRPHHIGFPLGKLIQFGKQLGKITR